MCMILPKISDLDVAGKKVLLRLDLDTEPDPNDLRIKSSEETLDYLKKKGAQIIILAHKGRPEGKVDESLSLKPFQPIFDKWGAKVEENLRFDPGEEKNDPEFAKKLALKGEAFINEAFASSHREHASIVELPKLLPHAVGLRFAKEIENLTGIIDPTASSGSRRPVTIIISGIKKDKVEMAKKLSEIYDKVLAGGRLPEYFGDKALESVRSQDGKLVVGNLTMDKEDITLNTVEKFKEEIGKAGTIVLAGVLGKYEDEGHRQGTKEVFEAVAASSAYKVAGGGDTELALAMFGLTDKFDWVSVGGGAMLEFLINKTLPGISVLQNE